MMSNPDHRLSIVPAGHDGLIDAEERVARGPGTPTVAIDGTRITEALSGWIFERESFDELLKLSARQTTG
ncbi:hypothetical protein ACFVX6_32870 [Streptomyces sp. NPDC058289]|uniref:hypothetical protein n=1 Tax=Streptomyces sp. NPDC058289 TaxID=3346425 RepID=UPI0036E8D417